MGFLRIAVIGTKASGKSTITNFLADYNSNRELDEYTPTAVLRILKPKFNLSAGETLVELWDFGNEYHVLPAIAKDADGVLFVVDPNNVDADDLEAFRNAFHEINHEKALVLMHSKTRSSQAPPSLPEAFHDIPIIQTTMMSKNSMKTLRNEFCNLCERIVALMEE
eukprot:TRINITY_DN2320_c0_g1_i1.p1 TRINITY_DN2320_c0_g1~~TRINITY_DN2320_c0_g1_i1.p1  ORF type:complete len:176 (+),score=46.79 TRINITY_DN2320_c0_g1_i1:33-530(+)